MGHAIETTNLTKRFTLPMGGTSRVMALSEVTIAVHQGEIFGLLGPNGAGKTTLLKILATLVLPTSGEAHVNGFDVLRQPDRVKRSIGLVSDGERSFYGRLTGRQNLKFFLALHGRSGWTMRRRLEELINFLGLAPVIDTMFQRYSTGMKQRLAIARALLIDPPILFFDEPTKSLDAGTAERLHRFLRQELASAQRKTILLTTHNLQEAKALCDRAGILYQGRLLAVGGPTEIARQFQAEGEGSWPFVC